MAKIHSHFAAVHESVAVQVLGRLHDDPIHTRRRQASEKRQGTKSREVERRRRSALWGISPSGHCRDGRFWGAAVGGTDRFGGTEGVWTSRKRVEPLLGGCFRAGVKVDKASEGAVGP